MNDRVRPLLLLLVFVLLLWAALQMPGVHLPFDRRALSGPLPGMNQSQCVEAGGRYDLVLGCSSAGDNK